MATFTFTNATFNGNMDDPDNWDNAGSPGIPGPSDLADMGTGMISSGTCYAPAIGSGPTINGFGVTFNSTVNFSGGSASTATFNGVATLAGMNVTLVTFNADVDFSGCTVGGPTCNANATITSGSCSGITVGGNLFASGVNIGGCSVTGTLSMINGTFSSGSIGGVFTADNVTFTGDAGSGTLNCTNGCTFSNNMSRNITTVGGQFNAGVAIYGSIVSTGATSYNSGSYFGNVTATGADFYDGTYSADCFLTNCTINSSNVHFNTAVTMTGCTVSDGLGGDTAFNSCVVTGGHWSNITLGGTVNMTGGTFSTLNFGGHVTQIINFGILNITLIATWPSAANVKSGVSRGSVNAVSVGTGTLPSGATVGYAG